jgi:NitT/TauT family transport system substrate-binding protein
MAHRLAHLLVACAIIVTIAFPSSAEVAHIGFQRTALSGPIYIAADKGYFAAEGIEPDFVFFDGAEPIAVATVSGDIDFGITGLTAAFYNLAGKGALRIVTAYAREAPGFQSAAIVASKRAYDAGFKSLKDAPGHSFGVTQIGSTYHYSLGLLAEKYHFDLSSVRLLPLQSVPNIVSALAGGQADAGLLTAPAAIQMTEKGNGKLLGWVGDETPWQPGVVIASAKTTDTRGDFIRRFIRAFVRGPKDFHDAFTGPDEKRRDMAGASENLALIAKHLNQPIDQVRSAITYMDPEARLDVKDVMHQIDWYAAQKLTKDKVDGEKLIDRRYVVALP